MKHRDKLLMFFIPGLAFALFSYCFAVPYIIHGEGEPIFLGA